jgi:zinc protease
VLGVALAQVLAPADAARAQQAPAVRPTACWACVPAPVRGVAFGGPKIEEVMLGNGMRALIVRRDGVPLLRVLLVARSNASTTAADEIGYAGALAAGVSSLVLPHGLTLSQAVDDLGLGNGTSTDRLGFRWYVNATSAQLAPTLALVAQFLARGSIPDSVILAIRADRLAALDRAASDPQQAALNAINFLLYPPGHPDRWPTTGTRSSMTQLSPSRLRAYQKRVTHPSRLTVIVVSDLPRDTVEAALERTLGLVQGAERSATAPLPTPAAAPVSRPARARVALVPRPGSAQSVVRLAAIGPRQGEPDWAAFEVLNMIFSGSSAARLDQRLRARAGLSYEVRSSVQSFEASGRLYLPFSVTSRETARAVAETLDELSTMRRSISFEEVEHAKRTLVRGFPDGFVSTFGVGLRAYEMVLRDLPLHYYASYANRVESVTVGDVRAAMRKYLSPEQVHLAIVGDIAAIEGGLRDVLGRREVVVLDADTLVPR